MKMIEKIRNWNGFKLGLKKFSEIINPLKKIDSDDGSWVSLGNSADRDLSSFDQKHISDLAYYKWLTDPLAARVVEIMADFIVGDGVKIHADDPEVQKILDEFWYNEINDFPNQQGAMVLEKQIFGEQLIVPFVNPISGLVNISRVDPKSIEDVIPMQKYPQKPDTVVLKKSNFTDSKGNPVNQLKVMRMDSDPRSQTAGYLVGDCFYFSMNKIAGKRRGHSQLLRTHEWIDIYGTRLFNEAERQELANAYVWDVTLKGAPTEQQISDFAKNNPRPSAGSVRVHSEQVEWNVITPDLKSADFAESNRQFLQIILGSYGLPEHYFALGGDVNYATAKAMSEPTLRSFKRLQKEFKHDLEQLLDYQIEMAYKAKRLSQPTAEYEICMDEINTVDLQAISAAITQLAASLQTAEVQGWISKAESAKAFTKIIGQANVEVDALEEMEPPEQLVNVANAFTKALEARRKKS